ncbi:desulfoferrodoxin family protein [Magnetococcales bacterium HHB-1]
MKRRDFIRSTALFSTTLATTALISTTAKSSAPPQINHDTLLNLGGGLFYTRQAPGRWAKKVGSHLPQIKYQQKKPRTYHIEVVTPHGMTPKHHIVKHQLLDANLRFLQEKVFDPNKDHPHTFFTLQDYQGPLFVASLCNLHDLWLERILLS